jgi:hypothetical protein
MSRTNHREKKAKIGIGKEYNAARPGGSIPGPYTKKRTHRLERRAELKRLQEVYGIPQPEEDI